MPELILATANARYSHASLGMRYLLANLGALRPAARLLEFTLDDRAADIAERILREGPQIVGLGVYVWNARLTLELVSLLKRVNPALVVIAGGPEVSHETAVQPLTALADYVVTGEGEDALRELALTLRAGERPATKVIAGTPPDLAAIELPYDLYSDDDLAHRNVYVEASRGCPFGCEFCLSSLEERVRFVPPERIVAALARLWERGLRRYRFVDRTFNLSSARSQALLEFFLDRRASDLFVHFEAVPQRFPGSLVATLSRFAPGSVQLEIGIQTLDDEVARRIGREQRGEVALAHLRHLRAETGAHLHADLVLGLPGEDLAKFAAGFDRLLAAGPHEIQIGILKRLRGAPIARHDDTWHMVYADEPPYELLQNRLLDFATMQRLKRLARYWDLVVNSGNFRESAPLLWGAGSPFAGFLAFSDWLFARTGRVHGIALETLASLLAEFLVAERGVDPDRARAMVESDYTRSGRRPPRLLDGIGPAGLGPAPRRHPPEPATHLPRRQARHHRR